MFKGGPYAIFDAGNGVEALASADQNGPIDLLVTDFGLMDGMSGGKLAQLLLERNPAMKILIISGDLPNSVRGLVSGTYWTLHKPFATEDLKGLLRRILGV